MKSILGGTSLDEVAWSAFLKATERLRELGKEDVGANVLGRKLGTPPPLISKSVIYLTVLNYFLIGQYRLITS